MNLIQAINAIAKGYIITSNLGRVYTKDILRPSWHGSHYASFNTSGMTKYEREGFFTIIK